MDQSLGDWCVDGPDVTVWVDASCFVTDVVIENGGSIAEDKSWLRPVHENSHINLAELGGCFEGRQPGAAVEGKCNSSVDRLNMRAPLNFWHLIQEDEGAYQGNVRNVDQVSANYPSGTDLGIWTGDLSKTCEIPQEPNRSTRQCPNNGWKDRTHRTAVCISFEQTGNTRNIHQCSGHSGVKCKLYFARMVNSGVPKAGVHEVVRNCDECQSKDLARSSVLKDR